MTIREQLVRQCRPYVANAIVSGLMWVLGLVIVCVVAASGCAHPTVDLEVDIACAGSLMNYCSTTNEKISFSLDGVTLQDIVHLTMKDHTSIRGRKSLAEKRITVDLRDVPPQRALIEVLDQNGLCICSTHESRELIILKKEEARQKGLEPLKTLWEPYRQSNNTPDVVPQPVEGSPTTTLRRWR